jgi:tRNA threonylcarbamoyl adenosine modification protein (Sua5/YciO/YrdC/YwlC family)
LAGRHEYKISAGKENTRVLLSIDPFEPEPWLVARVVQALKRGGVVVIPTDTVYAYACSLADRDAPRRLYEIKRISPAKRLSILVPDISTASRYVREIPNPVYRTMRRILPGPYTFIFPAASDVPRIMLRKRRTVGIRFPDSPITLAILAELGEPLLSSSVRTSADEFVLDPVAIEEAAGDELAMVVDGGQLLNEPSTVVDLSDDEPVVVREGKGDVSELDFLG